MIGGGGLGQNCRKKLYTAYPAGKEKMQLDVEVSPPANV